MPRSHLAAPLHRRWARLTDARRGYKRTSAGSPICTHSPPIPPRRLAAHPHVRLVAAHALRQVHRAPHSPLSPSYPRRRPSRHSTRQPRRPPFPALYLTHCLAFGRGQPLSFCYNPKRHYDTYDKTLSVCNKTSPRKRSRVRLRGKEPAMASYAPPSPSLPSPAALTRIVARFCCSYAEGSTQSPRPNQTPSSDSNFDC